MSPLFAEYRITDRRMRRAFHRAQFLCCMPAAVTIAMMSTTWHDVPPSLWAALGLILGSQMILSGAYRLHTTNDRLSRMGQRLADSSDDWFPFLLFSVDTVSVVTALLILWFALRRLGLPIPPWQSANAIALMLLVPLWLVMREMLKLWPSPRAEKIAAAMGLILTMFAALFVAGTLAAAFQGSDGGAAGVPAPVLVIWVPAILTAAACLVLILHRLLPKKKPRR